MTECTTPTEINTTVDATPLPRNNTSTRPPSRFRGINGQTLTRRLFIELSGMHNDKSQTYYTLAAQDHPDGYLSLYQLYLACEDPTEYTFGNLYFEDYDHWTEICEADWMKPVIKRWRIHLEARLKSKALKKVFAISEDDTSKEQFRALQLIMRAGWKIPDIPPRGRPSKDEVEGEMKKILQDSQETAEDYDRIFNQKDA